MTVAVELTVTDRVTVAVTVTVPVLEELTFALLKKDATADDSTGTEKTDEANELDMTTEVGAVDKGGSVAAGATEVVNVEDDTITPEPRSMKDKLEPIW